MSHFALLILGWQQLTQCGTKIVKIEMRLEWRGMIQYSIISISTIVVPRPFIISLLLAMQKKTCNSFCVRIGHRSINDKMSWVIICIASNRQKIAGHGIAQIRMILYWFVPRYSSIISIWTITVLLSTFSLLLVMQNATFDPFCQNRSHLNSTQWPHCVMPHRHSKCIRFKIPLSSTNGDLIVCQFLYCLKNAKLIYWINLTCFIT